MIILVDIDGTIASWGAAYDAALDKYGDIAKNIRRHAQQQSFNLHEGLRPSESEIVAAVMDTAGFYASLAPIPGAIKALHEMIEDGHEVFIVTSPWPTNPTCASDKMSWVMQHLGPDWARRLVIASDKTIVRGDVLFDDKPEIKGAMSPTWEHILFTQPYNKNVTDRRRIDDWSVWRDYVFPMQSGGMMAPEAMGTCPVEGCDFRIMAISEATAGVPESWRGGGSFEERVREHNRTVHDTP